MDKTLSTIKIAKKLKCDENQNNNLINSDRTNRTVLKKKLTDARIEEKRSEMDELLQKTKLSHVI